MYLGVTNILWLGDGIAGDDTDGHIDDLARFVNPHTIVTVIEDDPATPIIACSRTTWRGCARCATCMVAPFTIETLPMPPALYYDGTRLPASYANFYIVNGGVIVTRLSTVRRRCDCRRSRRLATNGLFPRDRRVLSFAARDRSAVWGLWREPLPDAAASRGPCTDAEIS